MKTEPMDVWEALDRGQALPFALVRSLSGVTLGPTPETVDLEELIEARFFSAGEEVRIFQGEVGLQAVCLTDGEGDIALDRPPYKLANKLKFGEATIMSKWVLDFDDDGQAFVACTRLTGWKGALDHA